MDCLGLNTKLVTGNWSLVIGHLVALTLALLPLSSRADPLADNFGTATALSGATNVTGTNLRATSEPFEPAHAFEPATHSVWAVWTAPVTASYSISTSNSTFDTVLAVYTGTALSNLAVVAINDDADIFLTWSRVVFRAYAGERFHIAVDGAAGAVGTINLHIASGGRPMLAWQSLDPSGRPVSSQDFSNDVLLVDFWETTCEACVAELPDLERLYGSLQPRGLTIIGLALDLDPLIVEEYLTDNLIPYPIAMANPSTKSAFEGIYGAPTKYLIDQERNIVGRYQGGNVESFYRGLLKPLFRSSSLVRLDLTRDRDHITLSWPISGAGYCLEAADHPDALIWTEIGTPPQTNGVGYTVKLPAALPSQFFRLQKP